MALLAACDEQENDSTGDGNDIEQDDAGSGSAAYQIRSSDRRRLRRVDFEFILLDPEFLQHRRRMPYILSNTHSAATRGEREVTMMATNQSDAYTGRSRTSVGRVLETRRPRRCRVGGTKKLYSTECPQTLLITLITLATLFAACDNQEGTDPDDGDRDGAREGDGTTFRIRGRVEGSGGNDISVVVDAYAPDSTSDDPDYREEFILDSDEEFAVASTFETGTRYDIAFGDLNQEQSCTVDGRFMFIDGEIEDADVLIEVVCEPAYTVGGTVSGLKGEKVIVGVDTSEEYIPFLYDAERNGSHIFARMLPSGMPYEVTVDTQPTDPEQHCSVKNGSGVIADEDVDDVRILCDSGTVGGRVEGLMGDEVTLGLSFDRDLEGELLTARENGPFAFEHVFEEGEPYTVYIGGYPENPEQECEITNEMGIIEYNEETESFDVENVVVRCNGGATVGGEIHGLRGSEFELGLSFGDLLDVEILGEEITGDGPFRFKGEFMEGEDYAVTVHTQPSNPKQECVVLNGTGVIEYDEERETYDVDDVEVYCAAPLRTYSYNNTSAVIRSNPVVVDEFKVIDELYGQGVSELTKELANGYVYSSYTGEYYEVFAKEMLSKGYSSTELTTIWRYRRVKAVASIEMTISRVNLSITGDLRKAGYVSSIVDMFVSTYSADDTDRVEYYNANSISVLRSKCSGTEFEYDAVANSSGDTYLWREEDVEYTTEGDPAREVTYGRVTLKHPVVVSVDLSSIPVGEEFYLRSRVGATVNNDVISVEPWVYAGLRDPLDSESDEGDNGVQIETEGLLMLDVDDLDPDSLDAAPGIVPDECPAGEERAVLSFESATFETVESLISEPGIRITRTGSDAGPVTARITLTEGTATAGEDFDAEAMEVRFGDGSSEPRSLFLPIINDVLHEDNETLTVTLSDPLGCAEIGEIDTAEITIIDDDASSAGELAFSEDTYAVDEFAGSAEITVERLGDGRQGEIRAVVRTADGTATAPDDYTATSEEVVFLSGEATPKTVQIPIADNSDEDEDRTVLLTLEGVSDNVAGQVLDEAVLTIRNDDTGVPSAVQFGSETYSIGEGDGVARIDVTRTGDLGSPVTVVVEAAAETARAGEDFEAVETAVSFAAGDGEPKWVEVPILNDTADEPDETVALALSGPEGAALGTPAVATLRIRNGIGWQVPAAIAPLNQTYATPVVAAGAEGTATLVWRNGTPKVSYLSRFDGEWGTPETLSIDREIQAMAFDADGNGFMAFVDEDEVTGNLTVFTSRYLAGSGFEAPVARYPGPSRVDENLELAVSASGKAALIWIEVESDADGIFANTAWADAFDGSAWVGGVPLEANDYGEDDVFPGASVLKVAVDDDGNAFAVWAWAGLSREEGEVRVSRFDASSGAWDVAWWSEAATLSGYDIDTGAVYTPQIAMDQAGSAAVVWMEEDHCCLTIEQNLWANHYDAALDAWSGPVPVEPTDLGRPVTERDETGPSDPRLGMDGDGNAVVIWRERDDGGNDSLVRTNHYDAGTGQWGEPGTLGSLDAYQLHLTMNAEGDAFAYWLSGFSPRTQRIARYTRDTGWSGVMTFPSEIRSFSITPEGGAFCVFEAMDPADGNADKLWYSRYVVE